ncbi:MAG: Na(+)-translocating NADH-quinone reductase subunit C [Planctomycetaceae bacterium]|nr:Na(+)-translocating NADH-quinone reductase subunit C [Planctomycetaceae bacterium]
MLRETTRTIGVAAILCVVCSVLVSATAVGLRPIQIENRKRDKQKNVLIVAGIIESGQRPSSDEIAELYKTRVRPRIIDLETGRDAPPDEVDAETYDQDKALRDPNLSTSMLPESGSEASDVQKAARAAGIREREKYAFVFEVLSEQGQTDQYVLPISGKGLWSTLKGFLAVDSDLKTIRGITFYSHAETPGLGGEIDSSRWQALWKDKLVFDDDQHQIDGLAGATLTARGVSGLVRFWLGDGGFGPFLKQLQSSNGGDR